MIARLRRWFRSWRTYGLVVSLVDINHIVADLDAIECPDETCDDGLIVFAESLDGLNVQECAFCRERQRIIDRLWTLRSDIAQSFANNHEDTT